jgi:hypothetical protein
MGVVQSLEIEKGYNTHIHGGGRSHPLTQLPSFIAALAVVALEVAA